MKSLIYVYKCIVLYCIILAWYHGQYVIWHATIMCGSQDAMNISSGILFSMIRLPKKVPLDSSACFDYPARLVFFLRFLF